jgi:hypothetical protein
MKTLRQVRSVSITILILLFFSLAENLQAQLIVTKVENSGSIQGKKGIAYNLSRTYLRIDLWITKTQQIPGPLNEFAGDYLGMDDVISESTTEYSMEDVCLKSFTEPDPNQVYFIEKEEKSSDEIWISFSKHAPVSVMQKFDKSARPEGFLTWHEDLYTTTEPAKLFRKYTESPTREIIDTIVRRVSIDTLVIESVTYKRTITEYSDKEKAEEAVDRIRQLDQDKYKLLVGYQETAYSKDALEFMYRELEKEKLEYLKLFTGISTSETLKFTYFLIPDPEKEDQEYVISALSKDKGIISPDGKSDIELELLVDEDDTAPLDMSDGQIPGGIVYRLPHAVYAVISYKEMELLSDRLEILQFGHLLRLPPEFKRIELDPETGELRTVVME